MTTHTDLKGTTMIHIHATNIELAEGETYAGRDELDEIVEKVMRFNV